MKRNLLGQRFGRLLVVAAAPRNEHGQAMWVCNCDCGNVVTVMGGNLVGGISQSCRCWNREKIAATLTKHGHARAGKLTKTYVAWSCMMARCYRVGSTDYHNYGRRGIKVCKRWHKFENFLADMGEKPPGLTLDRVNNDGNYKPSNCRWATRSEQRRNQRPKSQWT